MAVLGSLSVTLEVPNPEPGIKFYTDAGLVAIRDGNFTRFRCVGQDRRSIVLLSGAPRKRMHHVTMRADDLAGIARNVPAAGGKVIDAPRGFLNEGLWVTDPNGMMFQLLDIPADPPQTPRAPF